MAISACSEPIDQLSPVSKLRAGKRMQLGDPNCGSECAVHLMPPYARDSRFNATGKQGSVVSLGDRETAAPVYIARLGASGDEQERGPRTRPGIRVSCQH